jgi:FAD/FMN-containing dehydrogenase
VREHAEQIKLSSSSSSCERACAAIAETIPHAFFLRDEGDCVLWDAKQKDLIPSCRVEPSTPEEVSIILKAAIKEQCHFATRGGGHSRIAGSSNAEDGITIDLKKINQIEIAKDKKTVRIGGGSVWGDVYKTLEGKDLTVIGGRVSDVGVGGLILGGKKEWPILQGIKANDLRWDILSFQSLRLGSRLNNSF